jgi:hypothetical protein
MSYLYKPFMLREFLRPYAPDHVRLIGLKQGIVNHGLHPVGAKLHFLGDISPLKDLIDELGGMSNFSVHSYHRKDSPLCLILHPMGNTETLIALLEAIERATRMRIFNSPEVQIQVCSPGRLNERNAALLATMFYLGSDVLQMYSREDLETSFNTPSDSYRMRRLIFWDGEGEFDDKFEWWGCGPFDTRLVHSKLPYTRAHGRGDRTDILSAKSRRDIENINLVATLLMHTQSNGYWARLGTALIKRIENMLKDHVLSGIVEAPWLYHESSTPEEEDNFFYALEELVEYVRAEAHRIKPLGANATGILAEVQELLAWCRDQIQIEVKRFKEVS